MGARRRHGGTQEGAQAGVPTGSVRAGQDSGNVNSVGVEAGPSVRTTDVLEVSKRPKDSPFRQQRVKAWVALLTPHLVMSILLIIGVVFLPVGKVLNDESREAVQIRIQYDGDGTAPQYSDCEVTDFDQSKSCTVTFDVVEAMEPPIYVYYELSEVYQNQRDFIKSRSSAQLLGTDLLPNKECSPRENSPDGVPLNPCGSIAGSFFTDRFSVTAAPNPFDGSDTLSFMEETGIAWEVDITTRFKQPDGFLSAECPGSDPCEVCLGEPDLPESNPCNVTDYQGSTWAYWYPQNNRIEYLYETFPEIINPVEGVTNEHFMVWMRPAGRAKFRKPYGVIRTPLEAGDSVSFRVDANYFVNGFDGTKAIIMSTLTAYGERNFVVGIMYMTIGGISLLLCLFFAIMHFKNPRKLGDTRYLNLKDLM